MRTKAGCRESVTALSSFSRTRAGFRESVTSLSSSSRVEDLSNFDNPAAIRPLGTCNSEKVPTAAIKAMSSTTWQENINAE